jgi:hypothetical protein
MGELFEKARMSVLRIVHLTKISKISKISKPNSGRDSNGDFVPRS